jgi:hypothetical protein
MFAWAPGRRVVRRAGCPSPPWPPIGLQRTLGRARLDRCRTCSTRVSGRARLVSFRPRDYETGPASAAYPLREPPCETITDRLPLGPQVRGTSSLIVRKCHAGRKKHGTPERRSIRCVASKDAKGRSQRSDHRACVAPRRLRGPARRARSYRGMSLTQAVDALVDYETVPDDVDQNLGKPGFVGTPSGGGFSDRQSTSSYERHQATVRQRRRSR